MDRKVISEQELKSIVKIICESNLNRIISWIDNYDIATITAFRNALVDVTENTNIPNGKKIGDAFTLSENRLKNKQLKAALLSYGYGVTKIYGSWIEGISGTNAKEVAEESFFVVNINNDKNFFDNIFKLSEYFNQDSFLYKAKNNEQAILVGTNNSEFPGYKETVNTGELTTLPSKFMSRISKSAFAFVDKNNWIVRDTKDSLSKADMEDYVNSYSWRKDNRPTFSARKKERIDNNSLKEEIDNSDIDKIELETISDYTPKQRQAIGLLAKEILKK